ncbi:MAG: NUDIX hydrolase [Bdellovibrionota bacterium]
MAKELTPFHFKDEKIVFQCNIFKVHEKLAQTGNKEHEKKIHTLSCANWVNIVPVTSTGEIVLIEQHRFGTNSFVFELPGGAVDPGEHDATLAAIRELEEETGLTSKRILSLAGFHPNPAMQNNRIYNFIAFDVQPLETKLDFHDPFEEIKVHLFPIAEALRMARTGQVSHALSALALLVAEPYLLNKFP